MATERILIVDDEETLCEVLQLNLENEGYDVDIAFSAEQPRLAKNCAVLFAPKRVVFWWMPTIRRSSFASLPRFRVMKE